MSTGRISSTSAIQSVNQPNEPISVRYDADEFFQEAWRESLSWSSDPLTVDEIAERHGRQLPIIAFATRGYHDVDGLGVLSLAEGQTLQIYGYRNETRVHAVDSDGRRLSLPFECQQLNGVRFTVRSKPSPNPNPNVAFQSSNSNTTWSDVTSHLREDDVHGEPICLQIVNEDHVRPKLLPSHVTELTVTHLETHSVLFANCIENGWLIHDVILTIPDELKSQFRIAVGFKDVSTIDLWMDYCAMFERVSRHINESPVADYQGAIYSDWTDKRRPATPAPLDHVTAHPLHDVIVNVPPDYRFMSIADLNLTNSMTSLLQSGSCSKLRSESAVATSSRSMLSWKHTKHTNVKQQHKRRQKKVTPHVQDTEYKSSKLLECEPSAATIPSGELIVTKSHRSDNPIDTTKRTNLRHQHSIKATDVVGQKVNGFDQPRQQDSTRVTSDFAVTSTVHPVRSMCKTQFESEPCLTDRQTRPERIDNSLSDSGDDVTMKSCEMVAYRQRCDVIGGKAMKRVTRLAEAQCDVDGFGVSGPFDEGYQTKDSMSLEETMISQLRSRISLYSVVAANP